jgi:phospholipid transport system transporter-binding protein
MGDIIHFKPEAELTFKSVIAVRGRLYKEIMNASSTHFCLDLSHVTRCDSAGLALLIEAKRLCQQNNKSFEVIGVSPDTQSLAEFCGVESILKTS